ncbi:MAG: hypothetical protein QW087_00435 [Methanomassiliicoccales archaeon]
MPSAEILDIEPYRENGEVYLAIVFSNSQVKYVERKSLRKWKEQATEEKDIKFQTLLLNYEKNIFWETADTPLPSGVDEDIDLFMLQRDIQRCMNDYIVLNDSRYYTLVAHFIMCTWVHEAFNHAPRLLIYAPTRSGKTQLIRFLSAMCYRGHDYTNPSVAALYRDIEEYHPTICIDSWQRINDERKKELEWIYEKGFTRGGSVARVNNDGGKVQRFRVFSFMAVATKDLNIPEDLQNRSILIPMSEGKPEKKNFDLEEISKIKSMLLGLRFAFLTGKTSVESKEVNNTSLDPRSIDMAATLLSLCTNEDNEEAILSLIEEAQEASKEALKETTEADVFYALCEVIKEKLLASIDQKLDPSSITVSEVTEKVNEGREYHLTHKRVGQLLRTLGFELRKGSRNRTYFTRKHFHSVFKNNCSKFGVTIDVTFDEGNTKVTPDPDVKSVTLLPL